MTSPGYAPRAGQARTRDCDAVGCDESALLDGLRAGRTELWGEAFACCRKRMERGAARVLRYHGATAGQSVEDAVMTATADALRTKVTALPERSLCGWLATIAYRRALDVHNRDVRGRRLERRTVETGHDDDVAIEAIDHVLGQRLAMHLEDLLAVCTADEQHAVRERLMKGRPQDEVAGEIGCTGPNVLHLIVSASHKMRASDAFKSATSSGLSSQDVAMEESRATGDQL